MTNSESRTASTAHTPGPWGVEFCGVANRHHVEAGAYPYGTSVCELNGNKNDEANARLIAAAPDILAALCECTNRFASSLEELKALLVEHPIDELQDEAANEADERAIERARAAIRSAVGDREGDVTGQRQPEPVHIASKGA